MEGVLVSAKRDGSTVTITVVSDAKGQYSFPSSKLAPGRYALAIRAVGYELENSQPAEVAAQKTTQLDLKLRKAADLAAQLSNGEWLISMPGTDEQKQGFLSCVSCHTVERIARSHYSAEEFVQVLKRMRNYAQGSMPMRPQVRPGMREPSANQLAQMTKFAQYLSTINLSKVAKWEYPLQTFPRPKGKSTRVIITEYDLPRPEAMPHDAAIDREGMIWYSDFGSQFLGKLDPKTAKVVEYPVPVTKPGAPTGALDLRFDPQGNVWLGLMYQGSIAKFDRKTQKFQTWTAPKFMENNEARLAMVDPKHINLDGKVWIGGDDEYRLDVKTGEWYTVDYSRGLPKNGPPADRLGSYGIISDSKNNFYGTNFGGQYIIKIDAKTLNVTPFPTPTAQFGAAARPHGPAGPAVVRRISRQHDRHVRYQDRAHPRVGDASAVEQSLRCRAGQERLRLDRRHDQRLCRAAEYQDGGIQSVPAAADHQHSPGEHRQHDQTADVLGRQQSWSGDHQDRTVGVRVTGVHNDFVHSCLGGAIEPLRRSV